jgi:hypothetical protein
VLFQTWDAVEALLDHWDELAALSVTPCISTWVVRRSRSISTSHKLLFA